MPSTGASRAPCRSGRRHHQAYVVHTTFRVRDGLVVFQEDAFSIGLANAGKMVAWAPIPESAPPVEELRRRAPGRASSALTQLVLDRVAKNDGAT